MLLSAFRSLPKRNPLPSSLGRLPPSCFSTSCVGRSAHSATHSLLPSSSCSSSFVSRKYQTFHDEANKSNWVPYAVAVGASLWALQKSSVWAEEKEEKEEKEKEKKSDVERTQAGSAEEEGKKEEGKEKDEIPKYDYVIVGGGMSCVSALEAIRKNDKTGTILVVNKENHFPYERSPLSKGLWYKERKTVPHDVAEKLGDLYSFAGIDSRKIEKEFACTFLQDETVERAWGDDRVLALGSRKLVRYGKLMLATGSSPNVPFDVTDNALPHVSTFHTIEDFEDLKAAADRGGKTITIIGGGLTGCELASILSYNIAGGEKCKIIHLVREDFVLEKYVPRFLGEYIGPQLKEAGVDVRTNQNVKLIRKGADDHSGVENQVNVGAGEVNVTGKVQIVLEGGEEVESDYVIVATGSSPNIEVADDLRLELDFQLGGVVVNSQLEAVSGVYVAGDIASYYDRSLQVRRRNERGDNAIYQGQLVGHNMSVPPPDLSGPIPPDVVEKRISKSSPLHFAYQPIFSSVVGGNWFHAVGVIDPKKYKVFAVFDKKDGGDEKRAYTKGVVYYLRPEVDEESGKTIHRVMGILLWNISRIRLAQRTLKAHPKILNHQDLITLIPLEESKPIPPFDPRDLDVNKEEKEMNEKAKSE